MEQSPSTPRAECHLSLSSTLSLERNKMSLPPTYVEGFHVLDDVKKLKYAKVANTDMIASSIGIGGCSAGGEYGSVAEEESIQTLMEAVKKGVNYIDTSPAYGSGRSEEVIGKALRQLPRQSFYLATKVGRYSTGGAWGSMFDFSRERTLRSVDESLKRLGVDYVDVIQVHDLEFASDINQVVNETLPALQKVVQEGKARYIGITGYPLSVLKKVVEMSTVRVDTVLSYCRCTLLDQELLNYVDFFQSKGMGILNASITGMRLLTAQGAFDWHPAGAPIKQAVRAAAQLCESRGLDLGDVATRYALATSPAHVNILGCNDRDVLRRNLDTATSPASSAQRDAALEIQRTLFSGLDQTHWEGHEIQQMKEALKNPSAQPSR